MKLSGLHSYIHVSVPTFMYLWAIGQPNFLQQNRRTDRGIYKSLTDILMQELGTRPRSFISGNTVFVSNFRYSVLQCRVDTGYSSATRLTACYCLLLCSRLYYTLIRWNTGWDLIGVRKNQLAAYLLLQAYHNGGGGGGVRGGGGPRAHLSQGLQYLPPLTGITILQVSPWIPL